MDAYKSRSSIHHNAGWGVHIYNQGCGDCANDNVVSNNAIYDNADAGDRGPGILLSSGSGNLAYNNLIWGNDKGIQVSYGADAKAYNNVVYANDSYGIKIQLGSVNAIIRNNIVYQNSGVAISNGGAGTIQDHNLVETDPQFVDATARDFRLQPTSPAIDGGISLNAVPYDFAGVSRPRGEGFDIGAYEILSGPDIYPPEVIANVLGDVIDFK
ncbi:MAG: right-handed parallel beta-helix repeat-containing protein [Acidobacteria bacterium]|nr:right-handed parallel beta-helix repeat-containing protein [Acidobacteriota bacterium]